MKGPESEPTVKDSDPCISTVDRQGVPYNIRLKRAREAKGKSEADVAASLGIFFQDYHEWEAFEGELNTVMSLGQVSRVAAAIGIRPFLLFDDVVTTEHEPLSASQLCDKIRQHLSRNRINVADFEERVGFTVGACLDDPAKITEWNVDCLRFVCKEIGIDWRSALL